MTKILSIVAFFVCANTCLLAQVIYSISTETIVPEISVTGTSTLHGWKATAAEISDFPNSLSLDLTKESVIENFGFSVTVESLDGGRGSAMNEKIFKAFSSEENPQIIFKQTESLSLPILADGEQVSLNISGVISMAGQSADVSIPVNVEMKEDNLLFSGEQPLKMSAYGITPPSAMFGQIVTDDDIVVHYSFPYMVK
ncbi:MAG: hypothetical protein ACI9FN_001492 [Saprospiraceae bacterium]|jgi:hypothetical protein